MYPNKEVDTLRKAGDFAAALERGRELLKDYPEDDYLKKSIGWAIHDKLKAEIQRARSRDTADTGSQLKCELRLMLREYAWLKLPRPDGFEKDNACL